MSPSSTQLIWPPGSRARPLGAERESNSVLFLGQRCGQLVMGGIEVDFTTPTNHQPTAPATPAAAASSLTRRPTAPYALLHCLVSGGNHRLPAETGHGLEAAQGWEPQRCPGKEARSWWRETQDSQYGRWFRYSPDTVCGSGRAWPHADSAKAPGRDLNARFRGSRAIRTDGRRSRAMAGGGVRLREQNSWPAPGGPWHGRRYL